MGEESKRVEGTPFFGGVPVAPQVALLVLAFPVSKWEPGAVLSYDALAGVIGEQARSARFRTVVNAWRSRIRREDAVWTVAEPLKGIRRLTNVEQIGDSDSRDRAGFRRVKTAFVEVSDLKPENDAQQHAKDARVCLRAGILGTMQAARKELALPQPSQQRALPK